MTLVRAYSFKTLDPIYKQYAKSAWSVQQERVFVEGNACWRETHKADGVPVIVLDVADNRAVARVYTVLQGTT